MMLNDAFPGLVVADYNWISSQTADDLRSKHGFTHLISTIGHDAVSADHRSALVDTFAISLLDESEQDLLSHLDEVVDFIESALQQPAGEKQLQSQHDLVINGQHPARCVLFCVSGVSRSVSIAMAYGMRTQRLSVDQALDAVRKVRPEAG